MSDKKTLRVLSIDWDFFQIVDKKTLMMSYPDGVDLGGEISQFVWQQYYSNPFHKDRLSAVTIDKKKLHQLENALYLNAMDHLPDAMICNSHKNIYDFIINRCSKDGYSKINIDHLDMHHDMVNSNKELDCGNWISHLKEKYPTHVTWIANPISKSVYNLDEEDKFDIIREDLVELVNRRWDLVFLCRSDSWTPPHLDKYFVDLANFLSMVCASNTQVEKGILDSRWTDEYIKSIEVMSKELEEMRINATCGSDLSFD